MLVIVVENAAPRLRGQLAVYLLEVRAGVYVGVYSRRVRELLWGWVVQSVAEDRSMLANGVMCWSAPNDSGFDVATCGANARAPVDLDGLTLVAFGVKTGKEDP